MSIERAINKYFEAIRTDVFIKYEKDFAQRICQGLSKGYFQSFFERQLVKTIENIVNSIHELTMKDSKPYLELSTKSAFIHGNKSQVEFNYYDQKVERELGDLIFIISVVFNGQKYFEKFTINQFKRETKRLGTLSWNLRNKEQLYLLSRFPTFYGAKKSIIPMRSYTLPNNSGCLGSYGLLHKPGDFIFTSATELALVKHKNSVRMNELHDLSSHPGKYMFPYFPYHYPEIDELIHLMEKFHRYYKLRWYWPWIPFGNYLYANNVFDFSHRYLTMSIGEPTFMKIGIDNPQAKNFLFDLFTAIKIKAQEKMTPESFRLLKFIDDFFSYAYSTNEGEGFKEGIEFDFDGGGIGIIHTIINIGE